MRDLLKWEMKQTFQAKIFWGILIVLTICTSLFLPFFDKNQTSLEDFAAICSNLNSLMVLFIGVYAGVHVAGAFSERRIQAAVMAGNSRFRILAAKLLSYAVSVGMFCLAAVTLSSVLVFAFKGISGTEDSFFREVIVRAAVYSLAVVSLTGICFLVAFFVKNLGVSIVVNLILMLILNSAGPLLLATETTSRIAGFTAWGQTMLLLTDASAANLLCAAAGSAAGLLLILAIAYFRFRNEELK